MKILRFLIIIILFSGFKVAAQDSLKITWNYGNQSFIEFATYAESAYPIRFFFRDEWVADINFTGNEGASYISELLQIAFQNRPLFFISDRRGNIIITKDFAVKMTSRETGPQSDKTFIPSLAGNEDNADKSNSDNSPVEIGNPSDRNLPGTVTLSGLVTSNETGEPVTGVTVYNQKLSAGTITNELGVYSLSLPRGSWLIKFSFIGLKEKEVNINLFGSGELNVEMNSMLIPLKETVVSGQKSVVLQRYETGMEKISVSNLKLLPATLGEADLVKNILLLPGIQTIGEGSAGFNVRGGAADQNLILLYGAPVYNHSHFFGFFSSVNSDIIKDVTLYKGGIPARYGGRISSVLDISTSDGRKNKISGNAGISPVTTHIMVDGPLIKDKLSFLLAGRTTYSNWVLDLIDNPLTGNSKASFYDVNAKLTWDVNKKNRIDLASYISHDGFRFFSDSLYDYRNTIVSLRWRHLFNNSYFSTVTLNTSDYRYDISSHGSPADGFILSHNIRSTGLKADFNWYRGRTELNYGIDITGYSVSPGSLLPSGDSSLIKPVVMEQESAAEAALYFEDKMVITDYLSVNAGLRVSSFFIFGPQTVLEYDPGFPKRNSTVTDTMHFSSLYRSYAGPEYRISVNLRTSGKSSLKFNYNRTKQYLHLLSNTTSISPTDSWKLSDYYLKPQTGNQISAGFYHLFYNNRIEASAEIYYKSIKNMVEYKSGSVLVMNQNIEKELVDVRGRAYGAEFMLKKAEGKNRWTIGYTYSRTMIQSTGTFTDEIINRGEWFPSNFDKPHDLSLTYNYLFSRRLSFSANYVWSTGRPVTYPVATYRLGDKWLTHYSDRNVYRLPDYMRLDISLKISGNLKSKKIAHPHWIFSVYNLLGRKNVYSVYFVNENNRIEGYELSIFGRAIPSISFNFDF